MRLIEFKDIDSSALLDAFEADAWRDRSARRFVELGLPNKSSETYRYADIESVLEDELNFEIREIAPIQEGKKLIIKDGVVITAPKNVNVAYQGESFKDDEHFDPLYHLSHVASKVIITIEPEDGAEFEIVHQFTLPNELIAYRISLQVKPNTHAFVYESFEGGIAEKSLVLYGYDAKIGQNATLKMVKNQTLNIGSYRMVASHSYQVGKNATLDISTFDFGNASALQTIFIKLAQRAQSNLAHLLYADGDAKRGTVSKIVHEGEHSKSIQNAKNIISDSARGIFDALIKVQHSAKWTKAHQNSKAILLESGAYMASRPQLEIYIDELEASHGSTTGQLDSKQLFYLRSRGIAEVEARKMLIQAFANEVIDSVESETIREAIHCSFDNSFYGHAKLECIETCHGCQEQIGV